MVFLATSCTKEKVIHRACQLLKCENKARGLELPYEIRLPVEVYKRVLVVRTSSPSQAFRVPAHLSAFLFASFSNAYESNI